VIDVAQSHFARRYRAGWKYHRLMGIGCDSVPHQHSPLGLDRHYHCGTVLRRWLPDYWRWPGVGSSGTQQCINPALVERLAHVAVQLHVIAVRIFGQSADFNASPNDPEQFDVRLGKSELPPAFPEGDLRRVCFLGSQG